MHQGKSIELNWKFFKPGNTAAPHGGLSADGSAQKPVLHAAVQPGFQARRVASTYYYAPAL
ncbi:hypothetical protein DP511_02870 [Salmonella enterica]|uniref:Uncharacterized protein n=1 Tax=Salmonella abony TaxID=29482 RepID=A0A5V0FCB9_SALAB|nr:hypothetical protein [Salmonella enterica]EBO5191276.1 hypothetical protein [Salmonella enterica]EBS6067795.1 hypothetical protein [Salmonella enterica subsp. enterica serovar Abony]